MASKPKARDSLPSPGGIRLGTVTALVMGMMVVGAFAFHHSFKDDGKSMIGIIQGITTVVGFFLAIGGVIVSFVALGRALRGVARRKLRAEAVGVILVALGLNGVPLLIWLVKYTHFR
jgi:hypothetical protein